MAEVSRRQRTFRAEFSRQLGARLRELRMRRQLSQVQVARLMGLGGAGSHSLVGRVEQGLVENLRFWTVVGFLQAVGARLADVSDVLELAVVEPPELERRTRQQVAKLVQRLPVRLRVAETRYDLKSQAAKTASAELPDPAAVRMLRLRKRAAARLQREELVAALHEEFGRMEPAPVWLERQVLTAFGARVFAILKESRGKPQNRQERRIERAAAQMAEQGDMKRPRLELVRSTVARVFEQMERSGRLDQLPGYEPAAVRRQRERVDASSRWTFRMKALTSAKARLGQELVPMLRELGVSDEMLGPYRSAAVGMALACETYGPGTARLSKALERELSLPALDPRWDQAVARKMAEFVVRRWPELRREQGSG